MTTPKPGDKHGGGVRALLLAMVLSEPFRNK
jgi:hypothetical protein